MRVLHVVRRAEGGMHKHVSTLLSEMDAQVVHFLAAPREFYDSLPESILASDKFTPMYIGDRIGPEVLPQALSIAREARKVSADIIHCHGYKAAVPGVIGARLSGRKSVVTGHNLFPANASRAAKASMGIISRLSNRIIAVAPALKASLVGAGVDSSKIDVIMNGIDLSCYGGEPRSFVRDELEVGSNAKIVLCAARLTEVKGIRHLVSAAQILEKRFPDVKVLIAGDGPDGEDLRNLAADVAPRSVRFLGHRSDVADLLSIADVVTIPSLSEGHPLILVESMASGKPVVASSVGGMVDVIHNGMNGLLVPSADPNALAEAIASLLESPELSCAISAAARKYAEEEFDVKRMIAHTKEIYLCLVS